MKKILFPLIAVTATMALTSCLEETFPESSTATEKQVGEVASGLQSAVNGIPSRMQQGYLVYGEQTHETDMAYPQFMIAQTEMLGDMYPLGSNSGYDWYRNYNTCDRIYGSTSYFSYLPYRTLYMFVKDANSLIAAVDTASANTSDEMKYYAGVGYASRAFDYYMLTVFFEPKENIYTDISSVRGLTVPIVTEKTSVDETRNNPRATHEEMMKFIIDDLDKAEALMAAQTEYKLAEKEAFDRTVPTLATVYGLKAKVYQWDEKFDLAATYARKAINQVAAEMAVERISARPVTEAQMDDVNTGFNTANQAWMWYIHYDAENMGNLCNFTGWMSGEADWGYSSLTFPGIDKSLYDKMNRTDIRKRLFLNPLKYDYYEYKTCRDAGYINDAPAYLSLKFRCLGGDWETYSNGGAVDVPVMRIEEMYLIEAEGVGASQGVGAGVQLLNNFVKSYRDPAYNCTATDLRSFQLAVLDQMRLEFWGEGNAFPSAKRLAPDVIQNYEGTNAPSDIFKVNCKGIKPWWNLVIPDSEESTNAAIKGNNNPDPTQTVIAPIAIGQFAPGR